MHGYWKMFMQQKKKGVNKRLLVLIKHFSDKGVNKTLFGVFQNFGN